MLNDDEDDEEYHDADDADDDHDDDDDDLYMMGRVLWDNYLAMSNCDIHGKIENENISLNLNHLKLVAILRELGQQHPVDDMNFLSPWLPVLFRD